MTPSRETNSIFDEPWWLEAVAPNSWDCVEIEESGKVVARLPFVVKKKFGLTHLGMPPLTQTLGPWIENRAEKSHKSISHEVDLYTKLIKKLPKHDLFLQNFSPKATNWIPFYWEGFNQTTRYTYTINCDSPISDIYANLSSSTKGKIKKASNLIQIKEPANLEAFHRVNELTFERQGMEIPYGRDLVERIESSTLSNAHRLCLVAIDQDDRIHGGVFVVGDQRRKYLLLSGGDPKLRNSGAGTLLVWEAIKQIHQGTAIFDFEGSMLPGVEMFYRGFGAALTPYSQVSKSNRRGQAALGLRNLGRR